MAHKLARKKPGDLKLLHQALFGRKGKVIKYLFFTASIISLNVSLVYLELYNERVLILKIYLLSLRC